MEQKLTVSYRLKREDYVKGSLLATRAVRSPGEQKAVRNGLSELVLGVAMLGVGVWMKQTNWIYYILTALMMGLGFFSFSFYRVIFPKQLKSAAGKNYDKLNGCDFTLSFERNGVRGLDHSKTLFPYGMLTMTANKEYLVLTTKEVTAVLPASELGEQFEVCREAIEAEDLRALIVV